MQTKSICVTNLRLSVGEMAFLIEILESTVPKSPLEERTSSGIATRWLCRTPAWRTPMLLRSASVMVALFLLLLLLLLIIIIIIIIVTMTSILHSNQWIFGHFFGFITYMAYCWSEHHRICLRVSVSLSFTQHHVLNVAWRHSSTDLWGQRLKMRLDVCNVPGKVPTCKTLPEWNGKNWPESENNARMRDASDQSVSYCPSLSHPLKN